jgi:hypothetical protein
MKGEYRKRRGNRIMREENGKKMKDRGRKK